MSRKRVSDLIPGGFGSNKDVFTGANSRIRIKGPQRYLAQFSMHGDTKARSTNSAESPTVTRRSFIYGKLVMARQPPKVFRSNLSVSRKSRSMKSSAH